MNINDLKNPPKKYRPSPFWSWNEKLDVNETKRQVREMGKAGMGGYFMHARGGLMTEYLSKEWFDNINAAIEEGEKSGMLSWGYDENGWPSGFGAGAVNGLGLKYQQKYLRMETTSEPKHSDNTIINITVNGENRHLYYEVNPFYVDTLDGEVTEEFLNTTHKKYSASLGDNFLNMAGFFTDEPQVSRNGLPWSFILEKEYEKRYFEPLAPRLISLFDDIGEYRELRYRYWKLVRDLFAENLMGKIHDWCRQNGTMLTGHLVIEESFYSHIFASGCCMPAYEYMDIPGMDHLGRNLASLQTEMQVASVAAQLGKKQILSETFALCGWNVSFEDLRAIYEAQMNHGINYLCQHLEGYSLRGIRKRDYPASLFMHQPWWSEYKQFNDMVSRIGMLIAEGEIDYKILVLHTIETGWIYCRGNNMGSKTSNRYCDEMLETMQSLENAGLGYHLGDGRIMERHAKVENGILTVGKQSYSVVIVPPAECLGENTVKLLEEFKAGGGTLIFTETVPEYIDGMKSDRIKALADGCVNIARAEVSSAVPEELKKIRLDYENQDKFPVSICTRHFSSNGMTMYYIYNPHQKTHSITAAVKGGSATQFNPLSGDEDAVYFTKNGDSLNISCELYARGSVILFVYDDNSHASAEKTDNELISLSQKLRGEWEIIDSEQNCLTLDYCDLYFDGEQAYENLPISDVQDKACAFGRKVKTEVVFKFNVRNDAFNNCSLVVETPEIFDIFVNGNSVDNTPTGYLHDTAFKTIDIRNYVVSGENQIKLSCDFEQRPETYESIKKAPLFESEKNKLSYDMEIEAIYIVGDFAVLTDSPFEKLEHNAVRTEGDFYLCPAKHKITDGNIAEQGYPFFAGKMTFKKSVTLTENEIKNRSVTLSNLCATVTSVKVNGIDAGKIMWQPYSLDISELLHEGINTVEITIASSLRNMLGPFHLSEGESFAVAPRAFFHESPIWVKGLNPLWVDSYCFVENGLFF